MIFVYSTATFLGPCGGCESEETWGSLQGSESHIQGDVEGGDLGDAESSCLGKERKGKLRWNH